MPPRTADTFATVRIEGAILPADLLQRVAAGDARLQGLRPEDYHLAGEKLNEATNHAWARLLVVWESFKAITEGLSPADNGHAVTLNRWLLPFWRTLEYGQLEPARPVEIDGKAYPISHLRYHSPIHLVSFRQDLDRRVETPAGKLPSPHGLVQELLNRSEAHLWAFVSNGLRLRILRDNVRLTRQAFVEFDLQAIFDGKVYSDFALLWRLCHESRVNAERPEQCWLERWSKTAQQQGLRALDQLRGGVEKAVEALGRGFLNPVNAALVGKLRAGSLTAQDYYRQLLRVVYRLLFLFVAEDRELLFDPQASEAARGRYACFYSTARLRRIAERLRGTQHADLYQGLELVLTRLGTAGCSELGLPALGGLFDPAGTPELAGGRIANADLLEAVRALAIVSDGRSQRPVDYRNLGAEELGSVYESLLELHPRFNAEAGTFVLEAASGNERKTTGSYYTPRELITCLLDSALDPVLGEAAAKSDPEAAILALKVCDPACGSGHFLIAAAHRIARKLASVRTHEEEPAPDAVRHALRDVIGRCVFGVDINPMAVELCQVALWMEALEPGKPLSFLKHHIQCGNSLLGTTPALLAKGIPNEAFEPIEGDDKAVCRSFKRQNKEERQGQGDLYADLHPWERLGDVAAAVAGLDALPDDTAEQVRAKEQQYERLVAEGSYRTSGRFLADLWCAAFVWRKTREFDYAITEKVFRRVERNPHDVTPWMYDEVRRLAGQYQFLHWHLAFPGVFRPPAKGETPDNELTGWCGGFDVVLGNPPWERPKPEPAKYFASLRPDIAKAQTSALREKLLQKLELEQPAAFAQWARHERFVLSCVAFQTNSCRFPLSTIGKFNLGNTFIELARSLLDSTGRAGLLNVSGLATDDSGKGLIGELMSSQTLVSFYDFENRKGIFPDIHRSYKFSAITIAGSAMGATAADFIFFAQDVDDLVDHNRHITFSANDIQLLNPLSGNCPVFRERRQAELVKAIYRRAKLRQPPAEVIWDWDAEPTFLFVMSDHSDLFATREQLGVQAVDRTCIAPIVDKIRYVPLYESKMFHQFNHRWASLGTHGEQHNFTHAEYDDPNRIAVPRYWMSEMDASTKLTALPHKWLIGVREVTNATNERTVIAAVLPKYPVGHNAQVFDFKATAIDGCTFVANLNALVFDFAARTKVGGSHLSSFILRQLPLLPARIFKEPCTWSGNLQCLKDWLWPRVLELTYTAWDLKPFAEDCGYHGEPFRWDEERRFQLRCELDAAFFHLYLGTGDWRQASGEPAADFARLKEAFPTPRHAVEYIMDTFPLVRKADEERHGHYRTKDRILELYDAMAEAARTGQPYQTRLDPPPADPQVAHPDEGRPK